MASLAAFVALETVYMDLVCSRCSGDEHTARNRGERLERHTRRSPCEPGSGSVVAYVVAHRRFAGVSVASRDTPYTLSQNGYGIYEDFCFSIGFLLRFALRLERRPQAFTAERLVMLLERCCLLGAAGHQRLEHVRIQSLCF